MFLHNLDIIILILSQEITHFWGFILGIIFVNSESESALLAKLVYKNKEFDFVSVSSSF